MSDNSLEKPDKDFVIKNLNLDKEGLKKLKKKLKTIDPRSDRGVETLFRLVSRNQYTLNTMIDRKSNILITINALILSIIIGTVLNQLDKDPHLIFPAVMMLMTNLISISFAIFATRPELKHGAREVNNLMFYGNFNELSETDYVSKITGLMDQGDEVYKAIAKDTYYLGKTIDAKFRLLRKSFNAFLLGVILSVLGFIVCHVFFGDLF